MRWLTAKTRLSLGLVGIVCSLVLLCFNLGLIPDENARARLGRTHLAESVAVYATVMVRSINYNGSSLQRLADDLNLLAERNRDLRSMALRRADGSLLAATEGHSDYWQIQPQEVVPDQAEVPIWDGQLQWGALELAFKPLKDSGAGGMLRSAQVSALVFIAGSSFILFYLFLGRVLRQLDPSQAIPGRVRSALDSMAEGLLILDRKEQIVLANGAFAEPLGVQPDSLLGLRAGELGWIDAQGRPVTGQQPWLRAIESGRILKDQTLKLQLRDGSQRTFKANCSPVMGEGERYAGVLVSFNDITELEQKEVELIHSREAAEEANRAKSSFLANMSHEIRTPMNAILGFTEILKRGYIKNEADSLKYLNTIHSSGKNLLELINDILDLSKVESGHMEFEQQLLSPFEIIMETINTMKLRADEKGIDLGFSVENSVPETLMGDPARLRQIIFNLLSNAIKFTEQGAVKVICRFSDYQGGTLEIAVRDSGIGLSEKAQKKVFDPFVQADESITRRFGGTGLGLAISHRFALAMGGDITLTSSLGEGSTFTLLLPVEDNLDVAWLAPAQVYALDEQKAVANKERWQLPAATILVVDDGLENRELVRLLLAESGIEADEAVNGREALEAVQRRDYDVVLMDVNMVEMDGLTSVAEMRSLGLDMPVVALTANAMKGDRERCIDAGYSHYLSKPIDIDAFMELMSQLLGGHSHVVSGAAQSAEVGDVQTVAAESGESRAALSSETAPLHWDQPIVSRLANFARLQPTINRFVSTLDDKVLEMRAAAEQGDLETLAQLAHWLKGSGGTVGFDAFTEPATELEIAAKEGMPQRAAELVELLVLMSACTVVCDEAEKS